MIQLLHAQLTCMFSKYGPNKVLFQLFYWLREQFLFLRLQKLMIKAHLIYDCTLTSSWSLIETVPNRPKVMSSCTCISTLWHAISFCCHSNAWCSIYVHLFHNRHLACLRQAFGCECKPWAVRQHRWRETRAGIPSPHLTRHFLVRIAYDRYLIEDRGKSLSICHLPNAFPSGTSAQNSAPLTL